MTKTLLIDVLLLCILGLLTFNAQAKIESYRPVVLWHGMGDSCCNPESTVKFKELLEQVLPGVYVHSIMLGKNEEEDKRAGFFGNVNRQVAEVCKALQADEQLKYGFNAIGFSQGGLFFRAYVQRCNDPPVHNLITFGSPHQGVSDIPGCEKSDGWCRLMRSIVRRGAYSGYVRSRVIPAQYYKDPTRLELYKKLNIFLPDINNELEVKNATYRANLASLNTLVLIQFTKDVTLKPRDSAWFSFYGEDGELQDLYDTPLYIEDWIGLRQLDEEEKLEFKEIEGVHMEIDEDFFVEEVIEPYLQGPESAKMHLIKQSHKNRVFAKFWNSLKNLFIKFFLK
ncbi:7352_t:CDS:2 [Ambispora gerdemannii]|uniref:Palmitoyl-protein thioesterase 1 n=1 Tax=Ambispora gerdemannii TaxID=144530 RepID=A0A9N8VQX3_9GLOM|nr:7352_t:CDS:2 [Ambispora gerdemannii]